MIKRSFRLYFTILVICFGITLLAAWPGFFCYDAETEVYEVFTFKYSNHHPIVHELILGNALRLGLKLFGTYQAGITMYCAIQGVILAAIYAHMMTSVLEAGAPKWAGLCGTLFLGLFPPVSMFAVCTTKDGLFCGGIVLFATVLFRIRRGLSEERSLKTLMLILLSMVLILFFRNNGFYVLAAFAILILIFHRRRKRIFFMVIISCMLYLFMTEALIAYLPAKRGEMKEMLSVPMQQLARVHAEEREAFDKEDLEVLYTLIPEVILENYNPKCADPVKLNFLEDNFKADPGKYVYLWWKTFRKRPGLYCAAFWDLISGYLVPGEVITGYEGNQVGQMVYGESAYFQFSPDVPGEMHPVLTGLNKVYREISLNAEVQRMPVIGLILSPATWQWIFIAGMILLLIKRKKEALLPYEVPLLSFATVLLGPIALVRYVLFIVLLLPLVLYDALARQNTISSVR